MYVYVTYFLLQTNAHLNILISIFICIAKPQLYVQKYFSYKSITSFY